MQMESPTQDKRQPKALNKKALRRVFKDWDVLKALGEHSLADWDIVKARQQAAGYTPTALGRGLALREVLQTALETLRPDDGQPQPQEKRWRPHFILVEQYVRGRNPDWVQQQMHVARGTYYYEQQHALEMLASVLQCWEEEQRCHTATAIPDRRMSPESATPVPFLAPPRPAQSLVGRSQLVGEIKQRLLNDEDQGLVVLYGLPGVGKSTLALSIAHDPEVLNHFCDGVLWTGLGRQPGVLALLGSWAAALGMSPDAIASRANVAELAAAVHMAIGLRRMLLIVDDAWQIDALLAFKVGGPHCALLVTTRLPDVARSIAGDKAISVHELDLEAGLHLLAQLSPRAVELAPAEARALVQSVGGLPLALILMGRYLQKQSYNAQSRRLREALMRLQETETRLQLAVPDPPLNTHPDLPLGMPLSLQFMIGLSDTALDGAAHRALIDLSVFAPKPDSFSEEAALAVMAAPVRVLDQLVEHGLLEPIEPDRYTLHQTIADYAAVQRTDGTAMERLIDYFTWYAETKASDYPALEVELGNYLPIVELLARLNRHKELIRLIKALYPFLERRGLYPQSEQYLHQGNTTPEASGDQFGQTTFLARLDDLDILRGQFCHAPSYFWQIIDLALATQSRRLEAEALLNLGLACLDGSDPPGAREGLILLEQALRLAGEVEHRECEGFALVGLGYAYEELCDYPQAARYLEQALTICSESGNRRGEGWAHFNLGTVELARGNFAESKARSDQCLLIYRQLGDQRGEGWVIYQFGRLYRKLGKYQEARSAFEEALQILSDSGDFMGQGFSIHNLGLIDAESGDENAALDRFEQARSIFQRIGCVKGKAQTSYSLGVMRRRCGDFREARPLLEQALQIRREINHRRGECKALADLGMVLHHLGDDRTALAYGQQAVRIADSIGARPTYGYNLTLLGHIWADLERWDEAAMTYRQAVNVRRALGQQHLLPEPLAGLAQACLYQGDVIQAKTFVDEVLNSVAVNTTLERPRYHLIGTDNPERVYLTCYRILDALHDPRAEMVLKTIQPVRR